ncbi:MAG: class I SAM-dependent methyltransferase [Sphingomonas bacterium]
MPYDAATLRFYSDEAPVYTASGKDGISRHLEGFLALLRPGARILELGCGRGRDAEFMINRGFEVHPTDGAPEIAAKAEDRIGIPVRVMRFDEIEERGAYDAVYASASLLHVPVDDLPAVLAKIHAALMPGGLHFASYKGGGEAGRDRFGRYFNYLSYTQALEAYQAAASWADVAVNETTGGGYDGIQGPWLTIVARKT